jgi:hypothetical protein
MHWGVGNHGGVWINRDQLHADRGEGDQGQFDVLHPEGDADDGHEAGEGGAEVTDRQPPARQQEPEHIANHPQGAGAEVGAAGQFAAADRFAAEGPEGEVADHETAAGPGQTHDGQGGQQTRQPPTQAHHQSAANEPDRVQPKAQHRPRPAGVRLGRAGAHATRPWGEDGVQNVILTRGVRGPAGEAAGGGAESAAGRPHRSAAVLRAGTAMRAG